MITLIIKEILPCHLQSNRKSDIVYLCVENFMILNQDCPRDILFIINVS